MMIKMEYVLFAFAQRNATRIIFYFTLARDGR